jgi:predicted RecB family nuclease
MRKRTDGLELSASDLASHLGCHHLTQLDLAVAEGTLTPPVWRDPTLAVLQERGLELEKTYLAHLWARGRQISEPGPDDDSAGPARTIAAMRDGVEVIYQAALRNGHWFGRADFLQRVDQPSRLWAWSYEVLDAKLARDTRAGTILQLCLYSLMVGEIQGYLPERMHVILPGADFQPLSFRVHDFYAYHRLVQRQLETAVGGAVDPATYPNPVPQCDICRWWPVCDQRRHDDDHLCLVAGISRLQINQLRSWGVDTLTALAELPLPLERRPS